MDQHMADGTSENEPHARPMECDRETVAVVKVQQGACYHLADQGEIESPVECYINGPPARLMASEQAGEANAIKTYTARQTRQQDINRISEHNRHKQDRGLHVGRPHQLAWEDRVEIIDPHVIRQLGRDPQSREDRGYECDDKHPVQEDRTVVGLTIARTCHDPPPTAYSADLESTSRLFLFRLGTVKPFFAS